MMNVLSHPVVVNNKDWFKPSLELTFFGTSATLRQYVSLHQATYPVEWDYVSIHFTPGTGHFIVFLGVSHVTTPKGQLPDEDRQIWLQGRRSCKKVSSNDRLIQSLLLHDSVVVFDTWHCDPWLRNVGPAWYSQAYGTWSISTYYHEQLLIYLYKHKNICRDLNVWIKW